MTPSHPLPCNNHSLCCPTEILYSLSDASDIPHSEHMYSYISENKFGHSIQIIFPPIILYYKPHNYTHPQFTKPTRTHTHILQDNLKQPQ